MSIEPQVSPDGQRFSAPSPEKFDSTPHLLLSTDPRPPESCPACHASLQPGQSVCTACGTVLRSQPKQIRCRRCGAKASSAYLICPQCGRTLRAAPTPWLLWGIPATLLLLLIALLFSRIEDGPLQWVAKNSGGTLAVIENPLLTPVRGEGDGDTAANPQAEAGEPAGTGGTPDALPAASDTPLSVAVAAPTDTPEPTATSSATPFPSETATATPTDTSVVTAAPSATVTGTLGALDRSLLTITATITATNAQRTYTIQAGDTAFSIANRFQVTVAELLKVNQLAPTQALQLRSGTTLMIPGSGPLTNGLLVNATIATTPTNDLPNATATVTETIAATATATATQTATALATPTPTALAQATQPDQQLYTVASGDTFVGIALRFNISTDALLAANQMTIDQARDLRPGQKLIIPAPGQPLPPTATPGIRRYTVRAGDTIADIAASNGIPTELLLAINRMTAAQAPSIRPGDELLVPPPGYVLPTPTPRPTLAPSATPTPKVTIRLDAPTLIDPAQGINVPCSGSQPMRWNPVSGLAPGDTYVLFLGYVNSAPDPAGNVAVVPLLEQRNDQRTNWQMDIGYCNVPPQDFGRRWRWYVQVFNGDAPVSPPSAVWEFSWR